MKKISLILAALLILSVLAGCGKPAANNVPAENNAIDPMPTNTDNTESADNTVPPDNTADDDITEKDAFWLQIYDSGKITEKTLSEFLDGSWKMLPLGGGRQQEGFGTLSFQKDSGKLTFTYDKFDDKGTVTCAFAPSHLKEGYGNADACDRLQLNVESASEAVKARTPYIVGSNVDMEILIARVFGSDMIALREIGDGISPFGMDILMYDNQSLDGMWIFVRESGSLSKLEQDEETEDEMRVKSGSFYAIRWMDHKDSFLLQPVGTRDFDETFSEEPMPVKASMYTGFGNALYAVSYELLLADASESNSNYAPQLVYVTTDENGKITDYDLIPYFGSGLYSQEHVKEGPGSDSDTRDPELFGPTDAIFLGNWVKADDPQTWVDISADSVQAGGYKIILYAKDLYSGAGNANVATADSISINQCYLDGNTVVMGYFEKTESGIRFTVTASGSEKLPAGTTIDYVKKPTPRLTRGFSHAGIALVPR